MRLVFVHGALVTDGPWWWSRMTPLLSRHGITSEAVDLPSCSAALGDLHADVAAVRAVLASTDEPVLLCGHSYGGMVITSAAAGLPHVRHLIYIDSFLPEAHEALSDFGSSPHVQPNGDGTVSLRTSSLRELFAHDCDDAAFEGARARLTPQSAVVFGQTPTAVAWHDVPSTYVVCAEDRATSPDLQRSAARRAGHVVELPAGHHPFLSHPELLTEVIVSIAEKVQN
ncbi:alpha/beta hydrolase [Allokutzneria sp. A3M-2-11 16]|uniref:alpha/beta fold hydrolase n=1 Tax=Allokutzneria sp. A3M-2-11 16 TaxID=2962043 RepID=UPI0020B79335|nr:alpha/beta hydrolase [Allokutzneria sp. A3M-2-11 16]MCP3799584.1 alpha/beta hydrolase [Allokutzneria sp. A3M-2-11 16]